MAASRRSSNCIVLAVTRSHAENREFVSQAHDGGQPFSMTVTLNHTIVVARDKVTSTGFYVEILSLPPYRLLGHFAVVQVDDTSLDLVETEAEIAQRHFASLVSESDFDEIFDRIKQRNLEYWADPFRKEPGRINRWDDGRGVCFDDPNGHLLEIITRPYGAGGPDAERPNPLLSFEAS